jgi:hypothetical protein
MCGEDMTIVNRPNTNDSTASRLRIVLPPRVSPGSFKNPVTSATNETALSKSSRVAGTPDLVVRSSGGDRLVFELNTIWAITTDDLQWIVAKRRSDGSWRGKAFVAGKKVTLSRVVDELGITPTKIGNEALGQLKSSFREWLKFEEMQNLG